MPLLLAILPEGAIIRPADTPADRPDKARISGVNSALVSLDFPEGTSAKAVWRLLIPPQTEMGMLSSDDLVIRLRYTAKTVNSGDVGWEVAAYLLDIGDPAGDVTGATVTDSNNSSNLAYSGAAYDEQENTVTISGFFTGIDTSKAYTLILKITRRTVSGDLGGEVSLLPSYAVVSSGSVGGTPSGMFFYESPVAPQFSRWSPEIYLQLDGSLVDSSPKGRAVTTFGAQPPTFATDSPFGSGQCLQVNPDGLGAATSGLSVASNLSMQMSYSANSTGVPWAVGFWFKASAAPVVEYALFSTPIVSALGPNAKIIFVNTSGKLSFNQWAGSSYVLYSTSICDGAWHFIVVSFWPNAFGVTNIGDVYVDGVRVGPLWATYPNASAATPSAKGVGQCDTVRTYLLSDFWYQNAPASAELASLLWNSGVGRRFNDPATGLIEMARV